MGEQGEGEVGRELFSTPTHRTIEMLMKLKGGVAWRLWGALSLYANFYTGECWPSYRQLQEKGLNRRLISRGIKELEEVGLLERKRRFNNTTCYVLKGFAAIPPSPLKVRPLPQGETSGPRTLPSPRDRSSLNVRPQFPHLVAPNDLHLTSTTLNELGDPGEEARRGPVKPAGCHDCSYTGKRKNLEGNWYPCPSCQPKTGAVQ